MTDHFNEDIERAYECQGHLCNSIILGVRTARAGLDYLGIDDPYKNNNLEVFVEADSCFSNAVQTVTGCYIGDKRFKWVKSDKMAVSFIDTNRGEAIKIVVSEQDILRYWRNIKDEQIFSYRPVSFNIEPKGIEPKEFEVLNLLKI